MAKASMTPEVVEPLVAQILSAATFPDQVAIANYWVQQNKTLTGSALVTAVALLWPYYGLTRDAAGNLYGMTTAGGSPLGTCAFGFGGEGCGTVFKIDSAGNYTVLRRFSGGADGAFPSGVPFLDQQGNLYGATFNGGDLSAANPLCTNQNGAPAGCGVIFKLTP